MNDLISVVMPTWNRCHLIANAIRSIIDQTYKNWELIIVDDGSTDSTERLVNDFAHPRIKYHRIEHQNNISRVRNIGNELAQGKIIVVQDSDDISLPDRLEKIKKCFDENSDADVVYHGIYIPSEDPISNSIAWTVHSAEPFVKEKLLKEQYIPAQLAYTKRVSEEIKYNEEVPLMDDFIFLLELALNNKKFVPIYENLYMYKIHEDSINITGEADGRRLKDAKTIIKILHDKYNIDIRATLSKKIINGEELTNITI